MENKKFQSLQVKFAWMTGVVIMITLVIQMAANTFIAPQFYYYQKSRTVNQAFGELRAAAQISETRFMNILKKYEDRDGLRFRCKNEHTDFGYRTAYKWNYRSVSEKVDVDSVQMNYEQYAANATAGILIDERGKKNIRLRGYIDTEEDGRYYVQIRVSPRAFNSVLNIINRFSLFIFAAIVVLLIVLVYLYMRRLVNPLRVMSRATTKIANHNFSMPIEIEEKRQEDEITVLARNINKMSAQLKADMEELKGKNRELEAEIAYKNKMELVRKEFVANVSHELKTPIAVLSSYAQMLRDEKENIDLDYYCGIILEETEAMQNKVERLLELSCMEFGLGDLKMEDTDFCELLNRQLEPVKVLLDQKKLKMEVNAQTCVLTGYPIYLESIISNYLSNAIRYSPEGGRIRISLFGTREQAVFRVFNEGEQIAREDQENLWESFFQADKSHSNQGTGLGLYIVRKIVEMHQGEYGMRNVKGGVEFFVFLPRKQKERDTV